MVIGDAGPLAPQATRAALQPNARPAPRTQPVVPQNRRSKNTSKGAEKEPDRTSASGSMLESSADLPAGSVRDQDTAATSAQVVIEEPARKRKRTRQWARGLLSASACADSSQGDGSVRLSAAVVLSIDRQIATHFPALPRPPTVEFHSMLQGIFNSGLTVSEGLRLADECRQHGQVGPGET